MWASFAFVLVLISLGTGAKGLGLEAEAILEAKQQIRALQSTQNLHNSVLWRLNMKHGQGTQIWMLDDFTAKVKAAKAGGPGSVDSVLWGPVFYTSAFGYKMQVNMYQNGITQTEAGHVPLYITPLPGDYDSILQWPCSGKVEVTIYDQDSEIGGTGLESNNFVTSSDPFPWDGGFPNPTTGLGGPAANLYGIGWSKLVSHSTLRTVGRNYLLNDTLILGVTYQPEKKSPVTFYKEPEFGGDFKTVYLGKWDCIAMPNGYRDWASSVNTHGACILAHYYSDCTSTCEGCASAQVNYNGWRLDSIPVGTTDKNWDKNIASISLCY